MRNLIIDGGNLLYRTFFSSKDTVMVNSNGHDVAHILHFLRNVKSYVDKYSPDKIYICWDIRDKEFVNFRQSAVEYKEQRDDSVKEKVHKSDRVLRALCDMLGIQSIISNKLEADDAVAWLCLNEVMGQQVTLISADKDFMQLIYLCPNLTIFSPVKHKVITKTSFTEFSDDVPTNQYLLYRAVVGDSSDNIDGLKGYGPKRGKTFVENFKTNFNKLEKDKRLIIERNIMLMDLRQGLKMYPDEVEFYKEQIGNTKKDINKFFEFCNKLELRSITKSEANWREKFEKADVVNVLQSLLNG